MTKLTTADKVLSEMAKTFKAKNKVYKDNYKMVARIVRAMWPDGVPSRLVMTEHWHLFELKLVKLARFVNSDLTHIDCIHDDGVYSAMIEAIISKRGGRR